jgi:uncharacterized protein (TIGR03000 family)
MSFPKEKTMRRTLLILSLVAITLLTATNDAFAQRRGGGGGRGGGRGGGVSIRVGPGYYGPSYYGRGGYYPYYYGRYYDRGYSYYTPDYYYSEDPVTQLPATDYRQSFYSDPSSATITVLVPNQDAQVWFDDAPTSQRGMQRVFHTPGLQQAGAYTIKVSWTDNGRRTDRQRRVQVQPGQTVTMDFRTDAGETVPAPTQRDESESR